MPFNFYKQYDMMDCGPACLKMVAKHYKKNIAIQALREKCQLGKEGVNLLGISEAAESIGFRSHAVKIGFNSLINEARLPAIVHWNQNHFVVMYGVGRKKILVADPAKCLTSYSYDEFKYHWVSNRSVEGEEGIALLLEPSPDFYISNASDKKEGATIKKLLSYLLPHKSLLLQIAIGLLITSILQFCLPFITQNIIDKGVNAANLSMVTIFLLAQLALLTGRVVVEFIRSRILLHISSHININILTDFLRKLMRLPISFFEVKMTGDILQRMADHNRIDAFLTGSSLNTLFSLFNLFIFSWVLIAFNLQIFLVFLVATIIYSIWVMLFLRKKRQLDFKRFELAVKEKNSSMQLVQGMQEIKLNNIEKPMRWTWERLHAKLFKLNIKMLSLNQWEQAGAFFINEGKNLFITFLSARYVIEGQMTLGSMVAVQYIVGQLSSPIDQLIAFVQNWQHAKLSMDRLEEIHRLDDEEPAEKKFSYDLSPSFARKLAGGKGISFNEVSFTYPGAGNEPVLKNINVAIPEGKTTAIVGISGSGKTTFLKLLLNFYTPQQGEIKLDDTLLNNISPAAWRRSCGTVMQDSFIFSDSIARNIAPGTEAIDMNRLHEACEIANIREFIKSLPLGFNTKIGPEGSPISMGERQRILIARAVYKSPQFILFDEATNSLDANNEMVIIKNLKSFFQGRTVVIVAHRLSTVKHADQIIVFRKGGIVEIGKHQSLIEAKGEYYTLIKNQLELGN